MATVASLEKAIATNERYAANYRKAGKDPAKYVAKIAALKAELAALPVPKVAVAATLTFDQAYAKLLDAADAVLIAAGKPAGRDGAERGALNRDTYIELAKSIGVYDALIAGKPEFFGPEPPAGTIA